jgi:hypothetical protein
MSKLKSAVVVEGSYRPCDFQQTMQQIGLGTTLTVSGGRWQRVWNTGEVVGVELPVSQGYKVRVLLDWNDTYTVQRVWRDKVKGEEAGIYFDELSKKVYNAGMYVNVPFGGHNVTK